MVFERPIQITKKEDNTFNISIAFSDSLILTKNLTSKEIEKLYVDIEKLLNDMEKTYS